MKSLRSVLTLVVAFAATSAHAQLLFTLLVPSQTTTHSSTVSYQATLGNPGASLFNITGVLYNITGAPAGLTLDETPLLLNFPLTFSPGDTFTGEAFSVSVGSSGVIPAGTYSGDFTIQTDLGDITQNWDLTITAPPTLAPEMPAVAQLLPGLFPLALLCRRRKNTAV